MVNNVTKKTTRIGKQREVDPGRFCDERPAGSPFPTRATRDAVGDTTSVSRTPKDEQPIPRFIRLFAYMLQGCTRAKCNNPPLKIPCSFFFFRASSVLLLIYNNDV